jgi:hypothetical protein
MKKLHMLLRVDDQDNSEDVEDDYSEDSDADSGAT